MDAAVHAFGHRPLVLEAQNYLLDFYGQFGFVGDGPVFLDDGVPHTPMRRAAQ